MQQQPGSCNAQQRAKSHGFICLFSY
jgi:hypothetical protein